MKLENLRIFGVIKMNFTITQNRIEEEENPEARRKENSMRSEIGREKLKISHVAIARG